MYRSKISTAIYLILMIEMATATTAQTKEYFNHTDYVSTARPTVTISFDGPNKGNNVIFGTEFVAHGLTIIQRNEESLNLVDAVDIAAGSGTGFGTASISSSPNALSTSFYVSGFDDSLTDEYDFEFSGGASTAGLWVGNVGPGSTMVQFLDASGNVIAEEVIGPNHVGILGNHFAFDTRIFYGITTDQTISRIRTIEGVGDSDAIVFDDIQFDLKSTRFADSIEFFNHLNFISYTETLTVVDFDAELPGDNALMGDEFAAQGLTVAHRDGVPINVVQNLLPGSLGDNFVTEANVNSPPNAISSSIRQFDASTALTDNFDFILNPTVSAAGIFIGNPGNCAEDNPTIVQFLDELDQVIEEEAIGQTHIGVIPGSAKSSVCSEPIPFDRRIFYGVTTNRAMIKTIRVINGADDGDGVTIDDVQFGSQTPRPLFADDFELGDLSGWSDFTP